MEAIPKDVIECAILDGQLPQCREGLEWCEQHGNCYRCAKDIHDMLVEEVRRLKAERDRALAELDKALGEREDALMSERNAAYNAGYDEGFASADDWLAQHEDAMAEHGWYRAVDADEQVIRADDELFWEDESVGHVTAIGVGKRAGYVWTLPEGDMVSVSHMACAMHHHHAPTVEDVLRQFLGECESAANLGYDEVPQEVFDDYAAKLRLAGDE